MWSLTKESTAKMDSESELEGNGSRKSRMMTLAEVAPLKPPEVVAEEEVRWRLDFFFFGL